MNIDDFLKVYEKHGSHDDIAIHCDECTRLITTTKDAAKRNILQNNMYICRSCRAFVTNKDRNWTEEGLRRVGEATSYKRSDETCQKMSEAKIAFFKTPAGEALKKKLSLLASQGHAENKFENAKRNGWYESKKAGKQFYGSSYELRLLVELDADEEVEIFQTQVAYSWCGRGRCLDCLVTYVDGKKKAIEVKPAGRMNEQANINQVNDSYAYAFEEGWDFELYTEESFGMTEKELRDWADEFRSLTGDFDWVAFRREQSRKRAKKHYDEKISKRKVSLYCEFCQCDHEVLELNYTKNMAKNGRYICEREGGHIAGSKPKKKKENPYAAEGKKECVRCHVVRPFYEFGADKSRSDGYASRCKACRCEIATEKDRPRSVWYRKRKIDR